MKFCPQCANMFYAKLGEDANTIIYYCRNCGTEDTHIGESDVRIASTKTSVSQTVNRHTKHDPTLPRTTKMSCPNSECVDVVGGKGKSNIAYIRYNDVEMKYTYLCCTCDTNWNMDV